MLGIVFLGLQIISEPLFVFSPAKWEAVSYRPTNGERSIAAYMENFDDTSSFLIFCDKTTSENKLKLKFFNKSKSEFINAPLEVFIAWSNGYSDRYFLVKESPNMATLSDSNEVYKIAKKLSSGVRGIEAHVKYKDGSSKNISFTNVDNNDTPFGIAVLCNLGL